MDRTLMIAILLLVVGNNVAILSDSLIKLMDGLEAPFQFVFMRQASALLMLIPVALWLKRPVTPTGSLRWHVVRAHILVIGITAMVVALTTLPLATANALFYAAPIITVFLAWLVFKEQVSKLSVATAVLGMTGVLVIVNPSEGNIFVIAGLIAAVTLALNNLLIKKLPREHNVIDTLLLTNMLGLPAAFALMLIEGSPIHWSMLWLAVGSSCFAMIYAATCIRAYRAADSNKITSAEYTGLIGAVAIGLVFFAEQPDMRFYIGSVLIVVPLTILTLRKTPAKNLAAPADLAPDTGQRGQE